MSDPIWLKEPDKSGDSIVYVSMPEGSKLTPELQDALTRLGKALQEIPKETAVAREAPGKRKPCPTFHSCTLQGCQPYTIQKCFFYMTCRIQE